MPTTQLSQEDLTDGKIGILDLLLKAGLAPSKGEGRRLVQQGGVSVDDQKVTDIAQAFAPEDFHDGQIIVRKGKEGVPQDHPAIKKKPVRCRLPRKKASREPGGFFSSFYFLNGRQYRVVVRLGDQQGDFDVRCGDEPGCPASVWAMALNTWAAMPGVFFMAGSRTEILWFTLLTMTSKSFSFFRAEVKERILIRSLSAMVKESPV